METYRYKSDEIIYAQQHTKEKVCSRFFNNIKLQYNWFTEELEVMTLDGWKIVKLNDYVVNRDGIITVETERNFNILFEKCK